jgi:hypothetical protein
MTRLYWIANAKTLENYQSRLARAKQYIALRGEGFTTDGEPPKDVSLIFALPDGSKVAGALH